MTKNQAACITEAKSRPLKVDEVSNWKPGPGEVVIKNAAVAINPVDWKIQDFAGLPMPYPNILGSDLAGVIEEVGAGVTRLKKGDRVMVFSPSIATTADSSSSSSSSATTSSNDNKGTIIIWGAAGSVGLAAIQLARLSGLRRVIGVASARNGEYVKAVVGGAHEALDYRSAGIGRDVAGVVAEAGEGFVGILDAVSSPDTFRTIGGILDGVGVPTKVVTLMPMPEEGLGRNYVGSHSVSFSIMKPPYEHIADGLWRKFIPEALARGLIKAKPDPYVVGTGLDSIQDAMDR